MSGHGAETGADPRQVVINIGRPVALRRGWSAAPVRHGVSAVRSGQRLTLAPALPDAA
jgi:hypothetical protein